MENEALTHVDLASGIGGFSIAAESVGYETIAFYETDSAASIVLKHWWPEVRNHGDLRGINSATVTMLGRPDLLTAGVPCQPASHVGLRLGTSDPRWLWPAAIRAVRILRPRDAIFENPPALLTLERGIAFNGIMSALVALGYDLWWEVIPAAAFGAGHLRERLILVATDADDKRRPETWERVLERATRADDLRRQSASSGSQVLADRDNNTPINDAAGVQDSHHTRHRGSGTYNAWAVLSRRCWRRHRRGITRTRRTAPYPARTIRTTTTNCPA